MDPLSVNNPNEVLLFKHFYCLSGSCHVKLRYHPDDCGCRDKCEITQICPVMLTCTCYEYVYDKTICEHIRHVHNLFTRDELERLSRRRQLNHVNYREIIRIMSADKSDGFSYDRYFSNHENFNLKLTESQRIVYWYGYEHTMRRHELGQSYESSQIEPNEGKSWKVYTMSANVRQLLKNFEHYIVTFLTDNCEHNCSAFKKCKVCISCEHMYACNCKDYKSGFFCKHCHAVVTMFNGRQNIPYVLKNESRYYRDKDRRFYFLNLHTRIRHNTAVTNTTDVRKLIGQFEVNKKFIVYDQSEPCVCNELMTCPVCKICRHSLKCECKDYSKGFVCVHLHSVGLSIKPIDEFIKLSVDTASVCSLDTSVYDEDDSLIISTEPRIIDSRPFEQIDEPQASTSSTETYAHDDYDLGLGTWNPESEKSSITSRIRPVLQRSLSYDNSVKQSDSSSSSEVTLQTAIKRKLQTAIDKKSSVSVKDLKQETSTLHFSQSDPTFAQARTSLPHTPKLQRSRALSTETIASEVLPFDEPTSPPPNRPIISGSLLLDEPSTSKSPVLYKSSTSKSPVLDKPSTSMSPALDEPTTSQGENIERKKKPKLASPELSFEEPGNIEEQHEDMAEKFTENTDDKDVPTEKDENRDQSS